MGWEDFLKQIEFSVGRGDRIRFWNDKWCGVMPLKDLFPLLFVCSTNQDASIESVLSRPASSISCEWNISFVRDFNDWELPVVMSFFKFLHPILPRRERLDTMVWKLRTSGQFDVSSFYCALQGSILPRRERLDTMVFGNFVLLVSLMLVPFIVLYKVVLKGKNFQGKEFGESKPLVLFLSLFGQQLEVKF